MKLLGRQSMNWHKEETDYCPEIDEKALFIKILLSEQK